MASQSERPFSLVAVLVAVGFRDTSFRMPEVSGRSILWRRTLVGAFRLCNQPNCATIGCRNETCAITAHLSPAVLNISAIVLGMRTKTHHLQTCSSGNPRRDPRVLVRQSGCSILRSLKHPQIEVNVGAPHRELMTLAGADLTSRSQIGNEVFYCEN